MSHLLPQLFLGTSLPDYVFSLTLCVAVCTVDKVGFAYWPHREVPHQSAQSEILETSTNSSPPPTQGETGNCPLWAELAGGGEL